MFLLFLLLLASLHTFAGLTVCKHPCFLRRPYCVGGPVVAFIPAVACVPADGSGHDLAQCCLLLALLLLLVSMLLLASKLWQAFLLLLASSKFLMVSCCISAVPFKHAVAGGPAVSGFPAVDGILEVYSVPTDPGVPILAGGFCILDCRMRRCTLLDYC
jgi:hypothetical protein